MPAPAPAAAAVAPAAAALAPAAAVTTLADRAATVAQDSAIQEGLWSRGFTRRRFLAGVGMAGAAALGSQLVTTRTAFAATGTGTGNTLIVVFLRGGADGLRLLVPATSALGLDYLNTVRPGLVPATGQLRPLAGAGGWAANAGFDPLLPLWGTGELAFVPAVSNPGISRSHFQAQRWLESGGAQTATTGWMDRLLTAIGPGTTFRAVTAGGTAPAAYLGNEQKLVFDALRDFKIPAWSGYEDRTATAIAGLYRGLSGSLPQDVATVMSAVGTAGAAQAAAGAQNGAVYAADDQFGAALADLATLLRAEVGLQLATVDVGGWDTHTDEATDLDAHVAATSAALAAFLQDLGPQRRSRVTVAVMTEFGRRVAGNDSGGTDHGHGSVMWLLGGGLTAAQVAGAWQPLTASALDQGDVPALNQAFDVLGELAQKRLGVGSLSPVFPGFSPQPLGIAHA